MYTPLLPPPRRPWSPDPYDPLPPMQRREASDVSVEALDLADYARTLHPPQAAFYPPPPAPSLSHSSSSYSRYPSKRPFSLPPQNTYAHNPEIDISRFPAWSRGWYDHPSTSRSKSPPHTSDSFSTTHNHSTKQSLFNPAYNTPSTSDYGYPLHHTYSPPTHPPSSLGHESTRELLPWSGDPPSYGPPIDAVLKEERVRMLEREFGTESSRFGKRSQEAKSKVDPAFLDDEGNPLVGTVNENGYLVTEGPKKRIAVRVLQFVLVLGAGIPSIYAALIIKADPPPPPASKPPAYILYVLSVITLLIFMYAFVIRPCCCARKRPKPHGSGNPIVNGMMVLPVHNGKGDGKSKKGKPKPGKKPKKGDNMPGGDVQVNLIVDPNAFHNPTGLSDSSSESSFSDNDWGFDEMPGSYSSHSQHHDAAQALALAKAKARVKARAAKAKARKTKHKRRSVFAGLAMEEAWKEARRWVQKVAIGDGAGVVIWGAEFVYILVGKRCPSGGFNGWCNAYNTSTASACLLSIAFAVSLFFEVKDLHSSKASPRTRT